MHSESVHDAASLTEMHSESVQDVASLTEMLSESEPRYGWNPCGVVGFVGFWSHCGVELVGVGFWSPCGVEVVGVGFWSHPCWMTLVGADDGVGRGPIVSELVKVVWSRREVPLCLL